MELCFWGAEIELDEKAGKKTVGKSILHTSFKQVAEHGYKVGSGQSLPRIDQTTEVHI